MPNFLVRELYTKCGNPMLDKKDYTEGYHGLLDDYIHDRRGQFCFSESRESEELIAMMDEGFEDARDAVFAWLTMIRVCDGLTPEVKELVFTNQDAWLYYTLWHCEYVVTFRHLRTIG